MPFNLIKKYNELLEIDHLSPSGRSKSLKGVFNRDILENMMFSFRGKKIYPIKQEGKEAMEVLFHHLTTVKVDEKTQKREFESERSKRLHWIKHHISELKTERVLVFSVDEGKKKSRTYVLDKDERYVIILEPQKSNAYYLLTAYWLRPGNYKKIMRKYEKRRLPNVL